MLEREGKAVHGKVEQQGAGNGEEDDGEKLGERRPAQPWPGGGTEHAGGGEVLVAAWTAAGGEAREQRERRRCLSWLSYRMWSRPTESANMHIHLNEDRLYCIYPR